jgi:putative proteasome-type protease
MTYCLGMLLESGLVLMADTRTNAGMDNFSTFRKLHVLADEPDRQIYAATAGNLSLSQSVISLLKEDQLSSQPSAPGRCLHEVSTMFGAAQLVGEAVQKIGETVGEALAREHIDNEVQLLVGGRIGDSRLRLFLVYSIGNFIECTSDIPFLQIGETKYGRPILDRVLNYETPLPDAVKIGCLSFDSAMKSNLGVARPIDLVVIPAQREGAAIARRIERDDSYFNELDRQWGESLYSAVSSIPNPPWMLGTGNVRKMRG